MMRKIIGFSAAAGMAAGVAILAARGCDDRFVGGPLGRVVRHGTDQVVRVGLGWRSTSDTRVSAWGFPAVPPDSVSSATRPDPLTGIRIALEANMLPPHDVVRIGDLIGRTLPDAATPDPAAAEQAVPQILITTSPWNDDTLLLWVEIPGTIVAADQAVSVEFDPKTVTAFRPLGDSQALPRPDGLAGRAAMLYELSVPQDDRPHPSRRYGIVHIGPGKRMDSDDAQSSRKLDLPITASSFMDSIDDAPAMVRFAAAIAGFAELLRGDPAVRDLSCRDVINLAESADAPDPDGVHAQVIALMHRAEPLIDLPPANAPAPPPETPEADVK